MLLTSLHHVPPPIGVLVGDLVKVGVRVGVFVDAAGVLVRVFVFVGGNGV